MSLSDLRQNLANAIEKEYAYLISLGHNKTLILDGLANKYYVSIHWIRKHCNVKNYRYSKDTYLNNLKNQQL